MRDEIEAVFDRIQWLASRQKVPGVCVQILAGEDHFESAAGVQAANGQDMTSASRFPVGGICKALMALACAELHLAGRLNLIASPAEYLPELRNALSQPGMTLAHLLSHSSGYVEPQIVSPFQTLTWEDFVLFFNNREQAFEPGAVWSYTQTGHAIIARVLHKVVGRPALGHLKRQILDGLGIGPADISSRAANLSACTALHAFSPRRSRYEEIRIPSDSGFFRESVSDIPLSTTELLRLGRALNDRKIALVDPEAISLACEPLIQIEEQVFSAEAEMAPQAYGLGVGRYGDFLGLTGSYLGSTCAVRSCPGRSAVIAIAMNISAPGVRDRLLDRLMAAFGGAVRPPQKVAFAFPPERWVGDYEGLSLGSGVLSIAREGDSVACTIRRARGRKLIVVAQDLDGFCGIKSGGPASVGFHQEQGSNRAYVRIGGAVYRKVVAH
jgi:CubicO group peptidase (beta-lactamase class C family)